METMGNMVKRPKASRGFVLLPKALGRGAQLRLSESLPPRRRGATQSRFRSAYLAI
jgi:hypothetical protein